MSLPKKFPPRWLSADIAETAGRCRKIWEEDTRRYLEEERELYEAGDNSEVLSCLVWCLANDVSIPEWLKRAFVAVYQKVAAYEIESLDDAFGRAPMKKQQLDKERRNLFLLPSVFAAIMEYKAKGETTQQDLFERVTEDFRSQGIKMGSTRAKELYYAFRKFIKDSDFTEHVISRELTLQIPKRSRKRLKKNRK